MIGEANDYVAKGLSGGKLIIRPDPESGITPRESMIVGNTVLYGAITGECYFRGIAGERFAVRNSGAIAVVEGTGDHGCEYMTGGIVVVLGETGRNFAAGMSGGIAYVLDESGDFEKRCDVRSNMTRFDAERLHTLIEKHAHYTNSERAQEILANWDDYQSKFVKVMPVEYRRALQEMQPEQTGDMNIGMRRN